LCKRAQQHTVRTLSTNQTVLGIKHSGWGLPSTAPDRRAIFSPPPGPFCCVLVVLRCPVKWPTLWALCDAHTFEDTTDGGRVDCRLGTEMRRRRTVPQPFHGTSIHRTSCHHPSEYVPVARPDNLSRASWPIQRADVIQYRLSIRVVRAGSPIAGSCKYKENQERGWMIIRYTSFRIVFARR
jgi:hypothetical protein